MTGWIKVHRRALHNGWLRNPVLWTFWSYVLLKASHKQHTVVVGYQQVELSPGQLVFGRHQAALDLNLTDRQIRTCITRLKSTNNLTVETTNKFSVFTIVNWSTYQDKQGDSDQQDDQQDDRQATSKRPASDHIQERKKGKEGEATPSGVGQLDLFLYYWRKAFAVTTGQQYIRTTYDLKLFLEILSVTPETELHSSANVMILRAATFFYDIYIVENEDPGIKSYPALFRSRYSGLAEISQEDVPGLVARGLWPDAGVDFKTWVQEPTP